MYKLRFLSLFEDIWTVQPVQQASKFCFATIFFSISASTAKPARIFCVGDFFFDLPAWVENRLGTCCRGVCLERNERGTGGERGGRTDLCFFRVLNRCLERVHSLFTTVMPLFAICNGKFLSAYQIREELANIEGASFRLWLLVCVNIYAYIYKYI